MSKLLWSATILGEPCSKGNSRQKTKWGGVIKSKKALRYVPTFLKQLMNKYPPHEILVDVAITIRIWYSSRSPDLKESLILDLLQAVVKKGIRVRRGVYLNDRQVKEKHIYWMGVDKTNPRAEIEISEWGGVQNGQ